MAFKSDRLVAAIDFGTTFSSWGFSFRHNYLSNPTKIFTKTWNSGSGISPKAPTAVLIRPNGEELEAFGYEAEDKYAALATSNKHLEWYYLRGFKMSLYEDEKLTRKKMIDDETGKKIFVMTVIRLVIKYLQNDLLVECNKQITGGVSADCIHWVVTIPAIWNDKAKQFMREAAIQAGIEESQLTVALEPEAASLYCRHIPLQAKALRGNMAIEPLNEGTRYIVIDAGGGTVDITVHEVMEDGNIKELHKATGGAWGGQKVDEAFRQLLIKIFGAPVIEKFRMEALDDYIGMFREFELKKRKVTPNREDDCVLNIPVRLTQINEETTGEKLKDAIVQLSFASNIQLVRGNKLRFGHSIMKSLFEEVVNSTVDHIQTFHDANEKYGISVALLVGGFSESSMLVSAMQEKCPSWKFAVPEDAGLVVLKGAVLFGHDQSRITYRVCRYTYGKSTSVEFQDGIHRKEYLRVTSNGQKFCIHIFKPLIQEGCLYRNGDIIYKSNNIHPIHAETDYIEIRIYACTDKLAMYTTDKSCILLGKLRVNKLDMSVPRKARKVSVEISLRYSEIVVRATDQNTGKEIETSLDMLE